MQLSEELLWLQAKLLLHVPQETSCICLLHHPHACAWTSNKGWLSMLLTQHCTPALADACSTIKNAPK